MSIVLKIFPCSILYSNIVAWLNLAIAEPLNATINLDTVLPKAISRPIDKPNELFLHHYLNCKDATRPECEIFVRVASDAFLCSAYIMTDKYIELKWLPEGTNPKDMTNLIAMSDQENTE